MVPDEIRNDLMSPSASTVTRDRILATEGPAQVTSVSPLQQQQSEQKPRVIPYQQYIPMIDPSRELSTQDDLVTYSHETSFTSDKKQGDTSMRQNIHSSPLLPSDMMLRQKLKLMSSTPVHSFPLLPIPVFKTKLRSQIHTKILAIIYNPESTKFKTITRTKYYSTRICYCYQTQT